ncbi:MAG: DUF2520 domain-containing protein [Gaiellales bacterium]
MFTNVVVVGTGRVGSAVAARFAERVPTRTTGRDLDCDGADLVVICVPDAAIAAVARRVPAGPYVAHMSGATRLDALAPHERRFSLHPLQTFKLGQGPEQLDGAWGAISAETDVARSLAEGTALALGLRPFKLADDERPLYHAGAAVAASFLVTLREAAGDLLEEAGAPAEALDPLMQRVVENGFEHTGPHVRGDTETIARHREAIARRRPELDEFYRVLSATTQRLALR